MAGKAAVARAAAVAAATEVLRAAAGNRAGEVAAMAAKAAVA